jgi:nucleoside-diphosphate-sugar epimerase
MTIAVIGANGFVGSAVLKHIQSLGLEVTGVFRDNYEEVKGREYDVVINASNNSKKYISDREPVTDFDLSVTQQMRVLADFPSHLHVLLSSVDVYSDLDSYDYTKEELVPDITKASHYGFHKYLAEECVRHYAPTWLIIRLAGMVGANLKKNPVFDIINDQPLRIHPGSQYQFMHTADVAQIVWNLVESGMSKKIVNVCGDGLISPQEIADLAQKEIDLSQLPTDAKPRNVRINIEKLTAITKVPSSRQAIERFLSEAQS